MALLPGAGRRGAVLINGRVVLAGTAVLRAATVLLDVHRRWRSMPWRRRRAQRNPPLGPPRGCVPQGLRNQQKRRSAVAMKPAFHWPRLPRDGKIRGARVGFGSLPDQHCLSLRALSIQRSNMPSAPSRRQCRGWFCFRAPSMAQIFWHASALPQNPAPGPRREQGATGGQQGGR